MVFIEYSIQQHQDIHSFQVHAEHLSMSAIFWVTKQVLMKWKDFTLHRACSLQWG